jgi:transposase-like protein
VSKAEHFNLLAIMERFADEETAREYLESVRWPEGPVCPHCGCTFAYKLNARETSKSPGRKGLYKCKECRKQFTVTVGTIFEDSHIPLNKWLIAVYMMCTSKKGVSAHQLHRMLGLSYKAAWFMCHRVRYAMFDEPSDMLTGTVEADECYIGGKGRSGGRGRPAPDSPMRPVLALVERGGRVRSFHMRRVTENNLREVLTDNIEAEARLMTDELHAYKRIGKYFKYHGTVNHTRREYARGEVSTNTIEGFFGLLKRGIFGTFHHVGPHHLHRYLAEFDFRYNARKISDGERTHMALAGFEGKRLKYRD